MVFRWRRLHLHATASATEADEMHCLPRIVLCLSACYYLSVVSYFCLGLSLCFLRTNCNPSFSFSACVRRQVQSPLSYSSPPRSPLPHLTLLLRLHILPYP